MSCPTVEPKPSSSAVTGAISTSPELSQNIVSEKMSYPYKKRIREEFEEKVRHEEELRLHSQQHTMQQQQQQLHSQQQRLQQLQQQSQQSKKQKHSLLSQSGDSAAAAVTTSGTVSQEGESRFKRGSDAAGAETSSQQSHDSDIEEEEETEETSSEESYSSGSVNWSDLDESELEAKTCCCLAVRVSANKFVACGRPAFGIWFSNKLRNKALKKNLPLAYNKARGHWYTCLFHYRVIMLEPKYKPDETFESKDLSKYLAPDVTEDEFQAFKDDPLIKDCMKDFERACAARASQKKERKKGKGTTAPGDAELSEDEAPIALSALWPFPSSSFHTMRDDEEINASPSGEGPSTSSPPQVPFHSLSATTLRRYKKYFNLPHRSSTNTKQQLLEGILEHFETIDAPPFETVAHFLHTAKMQKNKLDHPAGDS